MKKRNSSPISSPSEQTTDGDSGGDSAAEECQENQEVSKESVSAEKCDLSEIEKDLEQIEEQSTKLADGYYEIEAVRRKRVRKGQVQYLIKWRGWPETANTWEPFKNLLEVSDVIDTFEESLKAGKSKLTRKKKRQHSITHVLPKKKKRHRSPAPATYSVEPHVLRIADEPTPLNDLVVKNENSKVNDSGVNHDEMSKQINDNSMSIVSPTMEEENEIIDLDLKLCELKGERAIGIKSTHKVSVPSGEGRPFGLQTSTSELQDMARADPAQPVRCTGARKRKSGSVKRFKKDPASCSVEDAQILEVPSVQCPDLGVNSISCKHKYEDYYRSCTITQIVKPISYRSAISNNVQDVLVVFEALRSDGTKVTVDNKFLKANNPLLLIDYYERNLRYNPT